MPRNVGYNRRRNRTRRRKFARKGSDVKGRKTRYYKVLRGGVRL